MSFLNECTNVHINMCLQLHWEPHFIGREKGNQDIASFGHELEEVGSGLKIWQLSSYCAFSGILLQELEGIHLSRRISRIFLSSFNDRFQCPIDSTDMVKIEKLFCPRTKEMVQEKFSLPKWPSWRSSRNPSPLLYVCQIPRESPILCYHSRAIIALIASLTS